MTQRTDSSAYGQHHITWDGDLDHDHVVDATDHNQMISLLGDGIGDPGYRADADVSRDGTISSTDVVQSNQGTLGIGMFDQRVVGQFLSDEDLYGDYRNEVNANNNTIGFAGAEWDWQAELYCMRNRYYDPQLGRFINRDPLGYVDGSNMYAYVMGGPTHMIDPMGLESIASAVSATTAFQNQVMDDFRAGRISAEDATRLIRDSGERGLARVSRAGLKAMRTEAR